jgi:hypothetical protein
MSTTQSPAPSAGRATTIDELPYIDLESDQFALTPYEILDETRNQTWAARTHMGIMALSHEAVQDLYSDTRLRQPGVETFKLQGIHDGVACRRGYDDVAQQRQLGVHVRRPVHRGDHRYRQVLVRYFELLDARDTGGLVALFAATGTLVAPGTGGLPMVGAELGAFFHGVGPVRARHIVLHEAQNSRVSYVEGFSRPVESGPPRYFLASALLDGKRLITRLTILVGDPLTDEQERAITGAAP